MKNKNMKKEIYKAFGMHISKDDLEKIINQNNKEEYREIFGVIIQFDANKITINEINHALKEVNKFGFIIAGIIGTYIFAYKNNIEEFDINKNEFLKNKKIISFITYANINYCGVNNIFNYIPYFLTPNDMFDCFKKIDFGNIYKLGKINSDPLIVKHIKEE